MEKAWDFLSERLKDKRFIWLLLIYKKTADSDCSSHLLFFAFTFSLWETKKIIELSYNLVWLNHEFV